MLQQPAHRVQPRQASQKPCTVPPQSLDDYLGSTSISEHLQEPLLSGRYDELAMDGSCASTQSQDSFLALMLGPHGHFSQECVSGGLAAVAALPNGPAPLLAGPRKASFAEQPPQGGEGPCFDASPELADHMLVDMSAQADSSDGSVDWFSAAQAQPYEIGPTTLQQPALLSPNPSRKRGRPRRYDTTLPLSECSLAPCKPLISVTGPYRESVPP